MAKIGSIVRSTRRNDHNGEGHESGKARPSQIAVES